MDLPANHPDRLLDQPGWCDRCGSAGTVTWTKHGVELRFCDPHSRENAVALRLRGWVSRRLIST